MITHNCIVLDSINTNSLQNYIPCLVAARVPYSNEYYPDKPTRCERCLPFRPCHLSHLNQCCQRSDHLRCARPVLVEQSQPCHNIDQGYELTIDRGSLELPSWSLSEEEDVQLSVGPALGLGQAVVGVDERKHVGSEPKEARSCTPIPAVGGQHPRHELVDDDLGEEIGVSAEDDGLGSDSGSGDLCDDRVA